MRERPKKTFKDYMEMLGVALIIVMFLLIISMAGLMNTYCEGSQCPEYVGDMSGQNLNKNRY